MWNLPRGQDFLAGTSTEKLKNAYTVEKSSTGKLRLLAAIHRKEGESIDDIAASLHKPRRTVHGWLHRFEGRGIKATHDEKRPGRPKKLTEKQLLSLKEDLIAGPETCGYDAGFWSTRLVQDHVKKKYKTCFVSRHMTRLLHKIGFSSKKPRPAHYKADKEAQKQFKKKHADLSTTTPKEGALFFVWTRARS